MEKDIEKHLRIEVKRHGGMALKFVSPGTSGVPDRIVLLPGGRMFFAELKAPGRKPRPLQMKMHKELRLLGFNVLVFDDKEQIDEIFTA